MRIIVSGGGTGGHIYPAITLINNLKAMLPQAEFLYVGAERGLENDIVPRENIPFVTLNISGFKRKLTPENFKVAGKAFEAMFKANKIIKEFKPDVAIGTGGYVCGPILLAASLKGIPTLIQEQNAIPGVTNKILAKFVNKIAVGYEGAYQYFPKQKTVFTGNPIREEVIQATRKEGVSKYNLDPNKLTILISGGSRGAHSINKAMIEVIDHFKNHPKVQLLHVSGQLDYEFVKEGLSAKGIDLEAINNIQLHPYLYDMPSALAAADICVFRAGATSLAELTARGIPAVLIPYPFATANHQEHNARELEAKGAAKVILNKDLTGQGLIDTLSELVEDKAKLQEMGEHSRALGRPQAAKNIAEIIISMAKKS